ncbi:integral membrane protein [Fonsecaea pedrosoi]|nr:integral membrane protein [Fonsecaea pedrosoi]
MDRLRDAVHVASSKLGRSDSASVATETVPPQDAARTAAQPPIEQPASIHPPTLRDEPNSGVRRLPAARDDNVYLPSIRLLRHRNNTPRPEANIGAVHDYATNPRETEQTNNGRIGNLWNKTRHSLGLGHTERDPMQPERDYNADMVDALDALVSSDPEVQTLISLTNVQNSLFVPDLGKYVNRRPTFSLTSFLQDVEQKLKPGEKEKQKQEKPPKVTRPAPIYRAPTGATINSQLSDSRYAVLPEGASLSGWTYQERLELNDHVRHMLHSRRSKFKRSMKGFLQYVRQPLGFCITLYATLITLFGLAWVLFLIGWINVGGKQLYVINVIDNVLVALFAIVGDGLAPFRAVDTYHMIFIAHYHHVTWSTRKKHNMPKLRNRNDLPTEMPPPVVPKPKPRRRDRVLNKAAAKLHLKKRFGLKEDLEEPGEYSVLNHKQQRLLDYHGAKFNKSHTFYKPHETETHHAFPLRLLVAIVVLLDCHSLLQIALGTVTWSIDYQKRPFALTTVILCCSITCNATAGLLIWIGDRRTRKNDVLERINRQELTQEAMEKMKKTYANGDGDI